MKKTYSAIITLLLLFLGQSANAQKPEKQISFAQETKPLSYYVQQAELWYKEIEKDSTSETNWYNYYRACRNAHGAANWKTDFVKASPYLKVGWDIVPLIEKHIPNTFTYYYVSYLDNGIGTDDGANLLKAYEMNPEFPGIHSSIVSLAESSFDYKLRKEANKQWYKTNYLSPQLLHYGYNILMSLEENAILITQNDNDTYPLWLLQDVMAVRMDVRVINVDFMLLPEWREKALEVFKVKPLEIDKDSIHVDHYEVNWAKITKHILAAYKQHRPLYLSMTLFQNLYNDYKDSLYVSGLAFKYGQKPETLATFNKQLYEEVFHLDMVKQPLLYDRNQANINFINLGYVNLLKEVYDEYIKNKQIVKANQAKVLAIELGNRIENKAIIKAVEEEFK